MKIRGSQNGQVLVLLAISIVVLLGITGLAIDAGIAYGVKAKLSSAVDAAALAAANNTGDSSGGTYAAAIAAGTARFKANYPAGYLNSAITAGPTLTVLPDTPNPGEIQVTVTASASVPTTFARVLGVSQLSASSTAQTVKKTLDMVFVIDNTGSLDTGSVPANLKAAAVKFIEQFNPTTDRIGLIKFAYGANVVVPISTSTRGFNESAIVSAITAMNFSGSTNFSEAFWDARAQLDSIPASSRSSFRVIVFFSDGSPNSFSSTFLGADGGQHPGVIISGDSPATPSGLDTIGSLSGNPVVYNIVKSSGRGGTTFNVTTLPQYATWPSVSGSPAGPPASLYQVLDPPSGTGMAARPVNASYVNDSPDNGFIDVNNAARNLPEEMANQARASGIYVYTLGLGELLTESKSWGNHEKGNAVLMNMANDTNASNYSSDQPTGYYAYAADSTELDAAFDKIRSLLLRLTK